MDTPHYASHAERVGDWWMHCISLISALIGGPLLIAIALQRGDPALVGAVSLYALCLVIMFAVSAAYAESRHLHR